MKLLLLNNENGEAGVGRGGAIDEVLRPAWREVLPVLLEGDDDAEDDRGAYHHSSSSSKWLGSLAPHQRDHLVRFPDLLAAAMHRQSILWALEAHLSGFEASMQLFDSVEEKCQAWWAAERVAQSIAREIEASLEREREGAAADGEEARQGNVALRDQLDEVQAIATLCRSSRKVTFFLLPLPHSDTTSYSASCSGPLADHTSSFLCSARFAQSRHRGHRPQILFALPSRTGSPSSRCRSRSIPATL